MTQERFCKLVKEVRFFYACVDKMEEALGCFQCENLYNLPNEVINHLEEESGKLWTDQIYYLICNTDEDPNEIWETIEKLEAPNND